MSVQTSLPAIGRRAQTGLAWRWVAVLTSGLLVYFIPFAGLTPVSRHILAFFIATIIALVTQPVPMGVSVLLAMTGLVLTGTLTAPAALSGFSDATVWLIFTAFLFSRAVTGTNLGLRVAYFFIHRFGFNALTLGYSIGCSDLVLAPFVPSDTARGGGIVCPITRSVAEVLGSNPGTPSGRMGGFLVLVAFHTTYVASAMFLTGMASNPLMADFALKLGHVELTWLRWFAAASVPGFLSLFVVPLLIYRLYHPRLTNTDAARAHARSELDRMGRLSGKESRLAVIMMAVMAGWITAPWHHIPNAFVALAGVCAILITRVLSWNDLLGESKAWDALIWFAPLIMMAGELSRRGVTQTLSQSFFGYTKLLPWLIALFFLVAAYLYIHYGFASMTAHITALYPGFLAAALATGAPPLICALALAYFSNLNAGITHYGTGSAPVYFGTGYVSQKDWWKIGFVLSIVNLVIWFGIGMAWWKIIGFW
ncbi:MAG TPA: DASS family sodium-coupled anion symporter [Bryobacteraceae bacterium]|nr:DASS family sodium-coupled anion symporter [Bryobacteraceae bacterium]